MRSPKKAAPILSRNISARSVKTFERLRLTCSIAIGRSFHGMRADLAGSLALL